MLQKFYQIKSLLKNQITDHATRFSDESTYHIPRTNTKKAESAFKIQGPSVWNNIPSHIRDAPNLEGFKRCYKKEILGLKIKQPSIEPTV